MKQKIITPEDLIKSICNSIDIQCFDAKNYHKFLKDLKKRKGIPYNKVIWIIAEWSE